MRSACLRKARRASRGTSTRTGGGAVAQHPLDDLGVAVVLDHPEGQGHLLARVLAARALADRVPLVVRQVAGREGQQPLLLRVEVLGQVGVDEVEGVGEAVARPGVGRRLPLRTQPVDLAEQARRRARAGSPSGGRSGRARRGPARAGAARRARPRRCGGGAGSGRRTPGGRLTSAARRRVAGGDAADDAAGQPELAPEEGVHGRHLAGVDRAVGRGAGSVVIAVSLGGGALKVDAVACRVLAAPLACPRLPVTR